MRISVLAVVVVGLLGGVAAAQPAPDKAAASAAYAEGQQRYAAGDYLPAATRFEAAYVLDPDPVYLFNVAQAYRLGGACAKAVSYYNRFLEAVPNPPNLVDVKEYVAEAEACVKTTATLDPGTATPTDPVVPAATERADDPGRAKRWAGLGAMVLGGAALGIGVYYTTEVGQAEDDLVARRTELGCSVMTPCPANYDAEFNERGQRAETRQTIAYAVGGALVVGGVVLYVLGRTPERSSLAVVPTTGGALAVGGFSF